MTDRSALAAAVDALEGIHRDLVQVSLRSDDARRDLVALRRRLADQFARIGALAEPAFADDAAALRTFRSLFSTMRSAAALHQANWPAVRLNEDPAAYQRSANVVRHANRAFIGWMRQSLAS